MLPLPCVSIAVMDKTVPFLADVHATPGFGHASFVTGQLLVFESGAVAFAWDGNQDPVIYWPAKTATMETAEAAAAAVAAEAAEAEAEAEPEVPPPS